MTWCNPTKCSNHYFIIEEIRMNVLVHLLIESIKLLDQILSGMQSKERMNLGQLKEKNSLRAILQIGMNF